MDRGKRGWGNMVSALLAPVALVAGPTRALFRRQQLPQVFASIIVISRRQGIECLTGMQGATVVDFAYHVHTDVGNQMVAAKVNGKVVSPSHVLSNAEVVQIVSYKRRVTNGDITRHKVWQPLFPARLVSRPNVAVLTCRSIPSACARQYTSSWGLHTICVVWHDVCNFGSLKLHAHAHAHVQTAAHLPWSSPSLVLSLKPNLVDLPAFGGSSLFPAPALFFCPILCVCG